MNPCNIHPYCISCETKSCRNAIMRSRKVSVKDFEVKFLLLQPFLFEIIESDKVDLVIKREWSKRDSSLLYKLVFSRPVLNSRFRISITSVRTIKPSKFFDSSIRPYVRKALPRRINSNTKQLVFTAGFFYLVIKSDLGDSLTITSSSWHLRVLTAIQPLLSYGRPRFISVNWTIVQFLNFSNLKILKRYHWVTLPSESLFEQSTR